MKTMIVETEKLKSNIQTIKSKTNSRIIAVVKGNGYGLGLIAYSKFLTENGIDFLAVADINDAVSLRNADINCDILLLTPTNVESEAETLINNKIIATIGSVNSAVLINETAKKMGVNSDVHIKIDTGFGRFGFLSEQMDVSYGIFKTLESLNIVGIYTHLSSAFAKKEALSRQQFDKFIECVNKLKNNGVETGLLHIANSPAFFKFPEMHLDAVRLGSALIGIVQNVKKHNLKRACSIKSNIIELKDLPANQNIGYGNTFKTKRDTRIGIVPIGYMDGLGLEKARDTFRFRDIMRYVFNDLKSLNNKSFGRVNGKRCRILGRVSMYNVIVDLTKIEAKIGNDVFFDINPILVDSSIIREYI